MYLVSTGDAEFTKLWRSLQIEGEHLDVLYDAANLDYCREYCGNPKIVDLSCLVSDGAVALCGVMAFLRFDWGSYEISSFGLPVLYVEYQNRNVTKFTWAQRTLHKTFKWLGSLALIFHKKLAF